MNAVKTLKTVPLVLAALLLSACSLAPIYERPALPVAGDWPAAVAPAVQAGDTVAHDIRWQDFFQDERLKQAIGLALEHNRDLRVPARCTKCRRPTGCRRSTPVFPVPANGCRTSWRQAAMAARRAAIPPASA
jgi:multidrug efflux system outer membrane protein